MDQIIWLVDKLSIPFIMHDKTKIVHANKAFTQFLTQEDDLTQMDFIQWLQNTIKSKDDSTAIIEAINNQQEIALSADGKVKGTLHHWTIGSSIMPSTKTSNSNRATWLQDSSSSYISKSYWDLHLRVSKATMQLMREIADRTLAEEKAVQLNKELISAQQELVTASREAGMAEVAISVLHNIGNVLNSVSVSMGLLKENMNGLVYQKIGSVVDMLKAHQSHVLDYFQHDDQGKLLPEYLSILFEEIQSNKKLLSEEIDNLYQHYGIIKDILNAENELTSRQMVTEKFFLPGLIESAIRIVLPENLLLVKNITLSQDYQYAPTIITDKIHLMQLIVNLLKNAKESILELPENSPGKINIRIDNNKNNEKIEIRVWDNGIGILPENLPKMFTFGFTTKQKGHGFGLHNGALIAKQLGGSILVESEGFNKGTTFILTLPDSRKSEA